MAKAVAKNRPAKKRCNKWETALVEAQFNEDSWQACVSAVVGGSPKEEEELIQPLVSALQQPQQKLFTLITWDSTLAKIHELGNPKRKKQDDLPMFYEVAVSAKELLDARQELPCDLLAKLLKFQLLQVKSCDQQRREDEQLESEGKKEKVLIHSNSKAKLSKQKEKDPSSALDSFKENKTKLKRRGEIEPPVYLDDEPDCGPQHYILLVGFHQPRLIGALDAIGVHVANVLKLSFEHKESLEEEKSQEAEELQASPVLTAEDPVEARQLDLFWSHLRSVLDSGTADSKLPDVILLNYPVPDLTPPFQTQDPQTALQLGRQIFDGVANLIYDSVEMRRQYQHYRDHVQLIRIPTVVTMDSQPAEEDVFKCISNISLHHLLNLVLNIYLFHGFLRLNVVSAVLQTRLRKRRPVRDQDAPGAESKLPPLYVDVEMCDYNSLLEPVPYEACSVPLILHCILEQVEISTKPPSPGPLQGPEEQQANSGPWLDCDQVSYMLQSWLPLLKTEEEKQHLLKEALNYVQEEEETERLLEKFGPGPAQKNPDYPLVISCHDERVLRLQDINVVKGINPAEVESSMMESFPAWQRILSVVKYRNSNICWEAVKQQLKHYCTDESVSWPEVERLFHQSVFEAMILTKVDQNGVLLNAPEPQPVQQQTLVIPWDNPVLYAKQKLQTVQTKVLVVFDQSAIFHLFIKRANETFNGRILLLHSHPWPTCLPWQVLQVASEEYSCLDIFRGNIENIVYVFCHNPVKSQRLRKEFWDVALHTDVRFRKYLEHVADKISSWTKEEELKREKRLIMNQSPAEALKDETPACSVVEEEALEPVIREDSLKAMEMEQERMKKEEAIKKSKNKAKGKQQKEVKASDKKNKALLGDEKRREHKGNEGIVSTKTLTAPPATTAAAEDEQRDLGLEEEPDNRFIGYITDGQLIHASGHIEKIYPSDGGRITVEHVSFVEGPTMMKVAVKKDGHLFHTHINHIVHFHPNPPSKPEDKKNMDPQGEWKEPEARLMKVVKQGSFSAVLRNQIRLSYSFYGPTAEVCFQKTHVSSQEPVPFSSSDFSSNRQIQSIEECNVQSAQQSHSLNGLSLSVPNGLLLQFLHEDTQGVSPKEGILVKQSFPFHGKGCKQHLQDASLSQELYRVVTSQGAVIRYLRDGSTEVLFPDGSVGFSSDSDPVLELDDTADGQMKDQTSEGEAETKRRVWQMTTSSGVSFSINGSIHRDLPSILTFKATDPGTKQVISTREDQVVIVQNPDGSLIVDHRDGTRISSFLLARNEEEPVCVNKSKENRDFRDDCDERIEMSRNSGGHTLHQKIIVGEDESVFPQEYVSESGKREEGGESVKERMMLVEKEGFATIEMYPDRQAVRVVLADRTIITGNSQAEYEVFPSGAGYLRIQSDGKCVYSSDLQPKGFSPTNQPGVYTMSHTDNIACDVTDNNGNHFKVMEDGQIVVLSSSPPPGTPTQEKEESNGATNTPNAKHKDLCPRLFLVHEDGSGTELLNSHTVEELLHEAYSDPTIEVLKEPLPDKQDEFCITILKPSHESVWSQWLLKKQEPDITPPNLRNRSWNNLPHVEKKKPGPPLGADVGVGLTLKERGCDSAGKQQLFQCSPKVLEIRQLYQHRAFTPPLRDTIDSRLKVYMQDLMKRDLQSEERKPKDPCSEEGIAKARDLLTYILERKTDTCRNTAVI
ncbi:PREDICTED: sperm-associated antigen 17-like [Cyprinodon variegatus]|uniref:sperm-associated antigen 17-like n=1 Tax=Cyprinodon variegatus TaxID=28743 RepID=UPI000742609B|nr:PREDICTED: sperm-associated antigen 17-like [Cyprinodon variegatus]